MPCKIKNAARVDDGPDLAEKRVVVDARYVKAKLGPIVEREDLTKFIL